MKPRLAVRALIRHPVNPEVLLGQRSDHDNHSPGKWALLGGRVDPYETPREAAIREIDEEAGVIFIPDFTYHVHKNKDYKTYFIVGRIIGEPVFTPHEHKGGRYAGEVDLTDMELAFDHTEIIMDYLQSLTRGGRLDNGSQLPYQNGLVQQ